jgi:ligand-binding sensor domain-containing protein
MRFFQDAMKRSTFLLIVTCLLSLSVTPSLVAAGPSAAPLPFPLIERFETFGPEDGLPAWKIHCVLVAGDRVWAGTTKGLAVKEGKRFRTIGTEQGLTFSVVSSLALDPDSGDLWIGTFKGLNRLSGGRIETFTQTSSGLPNDVIYSVMVAKGAVWVTTAAGVGKRDLKSGVWSLYDSTNTLMHEPWTYSLAESPDRVWVGVWAGGVLEHDPVKGTWKEYRDPDGEMEIDLLADDGPIHDVTSWVSWSDGILWQASYFGMARYEAGKWKSYVTKKTPLISNFVNFIATKGRTAWVCTDQGLSVTDGEIWQNYKTAPEKGSGTIMTVSRPGEAMKTSRMATSLPNDFVLGASIGDGEVWFATSHGLSRAVLAKGQPGTGRP